MNYPDPRVAVSLFFMTDTNVRPTFRFAALHPAATVLPAATQRGEQHGERNE